MKNKIKKLRKVVPLSRKELAGKLGLSKKTIEAYEQGWRNPGPSALVLLNMLFKKHGI